MSDSKSAPQYDENRLQQLSLTAWEVESARQEGTAEPRNRAMLMRSHERLQAELERLEGVEQDRRSQIRIHDDAAAAVLLIHGSTGHPGDLRALADHLHGRNLTVANVLLPGHGRGGDGLPDSQWKSCLNEAELRYGILKRAYGAVHIVGFSFGGALALHLARRDAPRSLTLLSAALNPRVGFKTRLMIRLGLHRLPFVRSRLGWNLEVFDAMEGAKPLVGKLDVPIYAAHCEDDPRIDPSSLRHLQKKSKHRASRFRLYPEGGHMILESHGRSSLNSEVGDFISRR